MKLLVSCDQVFDRLTRGPFPAGQRDDDAVERHLASCHECRELAEALRPAVALLHESLPASEAAALPAYGSSEEEEGLCERADGALSRRIRQIMDRQEVQPRRVSRQELWLPSVRLVAASILIAALGTLVAGVFTGPKREVRSSLATAAAADEPHQPSAEGVLLLASLKLPVVCLPGMPSPTTDAGGREESRTLVALKHVCCTRCHAAGKSVPLSVAAIGTMQQSCTACHARES